MISVFALGQVVLGGQVMARLSCGFFCLVILLAPLAAMCAADQTHPLDSLEVPMVLVPAGPFSMGSNWSDVMNGPRHTVDLAAFYIDVYEVTNEQYGLFIRATGASPPDWWRDGWYAEEEARLPVVGVNWYEATAFAAWAGKRLPTEQEWEKAGRGVDGRVFPWGHLYDPQRANTIQSGAFRLMPVGSYPEGISPWGVHDMLGNALEWTACRFQPYEGSRFIPTHALDDLRVLRGVSWKYEPRPIFERFPAPASWRRWRGAQARPGRYPPPGIIGFRCARDVPRDI